jgi:hypothetical protein
MSKREVGKALGFMLLGSLLTVGLLALWFWIAFKGGFPT